MCVIEIIRKDDQITSQWTGGTTTQLAIYPKNALYSERNFLWRLSSAKVEVDESVFTSLPGIWRHIMILKGELHLEHEGHHRSILRPYEQDQFSGEWNTKSFGKVTDFNLMLGEGCGGRLEALHMTGGEQRTVQSAIDKDAVKVTEAFYCVKNGLHIETKDGDRIVLQEGDLLLLHWTQGEEAEKIQFYNPSEERSSLINAIMLYND